MGVDIIWRSADGAEIETFGDVHNAFARAVDQAWGSPATFPLLATIDAYGRGMIIPPQTNTFRDELESIREKVADANDRAELSKLLLLVRSVETAPGSYLEYFGD